MTTCGSALPNNAHHRGDALQVLPGSDPGGPQLPPEFSRRAGCARSVAASRRRDGQLRLAFVAVSGKRCAAIPAPDHHRHKGGTAMADSTPNVWKFATIGLLLVLVTAGVTALVVSKWSSSDTPAPAVSRSGRQAGAGGAASQSTGTRAVAQPAPRPAAPAAPQADAPMPGSVMNPPASGGAASRSAGGPPPQA